MKFVCNQPLNYFNNLQTINMQHILKLENTFRKNTEQNEICISSLFCSLFLHWAKWNLHLEFILFFVCTLSKMKFASRVYFVLCFFTYAIGYEYVYIVVSFQWQPATCREPSTRCRKNPRNEDSRALAHKILGSRLENGSVLMRRW
jgi:hypothetical protein